MVREERGAEVRVLRTSSLKTQEEAEDSAKGRHREERTEMGEGEAEKGEENRATGPREETGLRILRAVPSMPERGFMVALPMKEAVKPDGSNKKEISRSQSTGVHILRDVGKTGYTGGQGWREPPGSLPLPFTTGIVPLLHILYTEIPIKLSFEENLQNCSNRSSRERAQRIIWSQRDLPEQQFRDEAGTKAQVPCQPI